MTGYAVDCETGAATGPVRLHRGGVNGALLGGATVGSSVRDLAQVCGGGATGLAAIGWSFILDTTQTANGATQFTAVTDTSSGRVQDSVIYNVMNGSNLGSGGQCNPYYPTATPLFPVNVPCTGGVTAAPTNVVATATSSTTALLTWTAAQGATGYVVLRSTTGPAGPYTTALSPASTPAVSISGTQATLAGLNPGDTYYLAVAATGPLGTSVASPANPLTTSTAALVLPVVNVLRNPNGVGGAPVGVCPGAGPCTLRFAWTEPLAASHALSYGIGPAGSGFMGSCSFPVTTSPSCDAVFNAPAGTLVHFQATSSAAGNTVQTPDLSLIL